MTLACLFAVALCQGFAKPYAYARADFRGYGEAEAPRSGAPRDVVYGPRYGAEGEGWARRAAAAGYRAEHLAAYGAAPKIDYGGAAEAQADVVYRVSRGASDGYGKRAAPVADTYGPRFGRGYGGYGPGKTKRAAPAVDGPRYRGGWAERWAPAAPTRTHM